MAPALPQGTRERIIAEAGNLFYTQGYNNTGLEQIAGALKLTKPAFYYHFRSKNELAFAYLEWQLSNLQEMLLQIRERSDNFGKFLVLWAKAVQYQAKQGRFYGCPFARFSGEISKEERKIFGEKFISIDKSLLAMHAAIGVHFGLDLSRHASLGREIIARYTGAAMLYHLTHDMKYLKDLESSFRRIAERVAMKEET